MGTRSRSTQPAAGGEPGPGADQRLDPALLKLCLVVVLGSVSTTLDTTIVNVALASVGRGFHAPVSQVQWISTGYLLAISVIIPVSGWSVDRFGARTMWLWSVSVFLGASVLCGVAWSIS